MNKQLIQNIFILTLVIVCLVMAVDHLTVIDEDTMVHFNTTSNKTEQVRASTWLLREADLVEAEFGQRFDADADKSGKLTKTNALYNQTNRNSTLKIPESDVNTETDWNSMICFVIFIGFAMFCFGLTCGEDDYWYYY